VPCARDAPVRDAAACNADVLHQRAEEAREGAWSKCPVLAGPRLAPMPGARRLWVARRSHGKALYWGRQPLPAHVEPPCHRRSSTPACSSKSPRRCGHAAPTRGTSSGTSRALTGCIEKGRGSNVGCRRSSNAHMLKQRPRSLVPTPAAGCPVGAGTAHSPRRRHVRAAEAGRLTEYRHGVVRGRALYCSHDLAMRQP